VNFAVNDVSERRYQNVFVPVVFTLTIFLSAGMLFFVQPLFAKLVLPKIGGAPGVWTTAMLFFQVVLLAGYVYAHLLSRYVPLRWQLPVHLAFWVFALSFIPLSVASGWSYDPSVSTAWQTLLLFAVGVGVPFGFLSANAPLLQTWYAKSGGPSADDPYFLYGASNFGSLLALVAFPLMAGPLFGISEIGRGWAAAFLGFGGLLVISGYMVSSRVYGDEPVEATNLRAPASKIEMAVIGKWLFLAFVPSSLMLSITTKISSDLGSFPLVWVVPFALYIFSFVITFSKGQLLGQQASRYLAIASLAVLAILQSQWVGSHLTWSAAILYAPALLFVSVEAHRTLYASRPDARQLTLFYITISVGGALGGLFNSILAPVLFNDINEIQVSVMLAPAMLLVASQKFSIRSVAKGILVAAIVVVPFLLADGKFGLTATMLVAAGLMVVFAFGLIALNKVPIAILSAIVAFIGTDFLANKGTYVFKDRSFFGAHVVFEADGLRVYGNGTTVHGYQNIDDIQGRPTPLSYYYPQSPMAQILKSERAGPSDSIGIVGLGVGSLACYAQPGQSWEFYEIDAMVDRVARDTSMFRFMSECAPGSQTHLGDARIVLEQQDYTFDILVLDAYSSDSIPLHLVTTEALELYVRRLKRDGLMVFHISNRYFDIRQPLVRIASKLGLSAAIQYDFPEPGESLPDGARPSIVVTMSPDAGQIAELLQDPRWQAITSDGGKVWTDDNADPLSAIR
jgi:hypothetical protein